MYQWIIIGGGIQGSCVASRLLEGKVQNKDLLIIDPHPEPMHVWRTLTKKTGMPYLRSPLVHHLASDPYSLKKYARTGDYAQPFKGQYSRPQLDMFNQHSLEELESAGVTECWRQGKVQDLEKINRGWSVTLEDGSNLQAERIVLAMGVNERPYYPEWANDPLEKSQVTHLFDLHQPLPDRGRITIVGGGMTAAHVAHTLSRLDSVQEVTLVKRHPFRLHDFDSDPGWLGPKFLRGYEKVMCYEERRNMITEARHRGSITRDLHVALRRQVSAGKLHVYTGEVERAEAVNEEIRLLLESGESISGDALVLATGAAKALPGKEWLEPIIDDLHLPCAPCGFPVVNASLEWKDGLFVSGALAELEVGPSSRNIAGARKAAERIAGSA